MSLADLKPGDSMCVEVFGYRYRELPTISDFVVTRVARKYLYASAVSGWPKDQAFDRSTGDGKDYRAKAHASRDELMAARETAEMRERSFSAMRKFTGYMQSTLSDEQCRAILSILEPQQ